MGLTKGQKLAVESVRQGNNVFITGGGGVGKSYVVDVIVDMLRRSGKNVLVTASTGKAATLIGGVTCHRAFNISLKATWLADPTVRKNSPIYETDVVLIDEVSMLRIDSFEFIFKSIESVNEQRMNAPENDHTSPIQIIVVGDFTQLPPVIIHPKDGSPDEGDMMSDYYGFGIGQGYAFMAPGWKRCHFVTCELTEVLRQTDKPMIDALTGIRFGDRAALSYFMDHKRQEKFSDDDDVVYLCGKNRTAETINNTALSKLSGKQKIYYSICNGQVTDQDKQAPDEIRLKTGAHVIMLQNSEKYRNGSNGTVTHLYEHSVSVLIHETGEEIDVPYTTWDIEKYVIKQENGKKKVDKEKIGSFSQLPLRLGYAITIHKSQGQTFDKVCLVLGSDDKKKNAKSTRPEIFTFGQLYVGLSRVKSMDGLYIEGNLLLVDILCSPEVKDFYGVSDLPKNIQYDATPIIDIPETEIKEEKKTVPKKKARQPRVSTKKALPKVPKEAKPEKKKKDSTATLSVIHCTEKNIKIVWTFASALSPESKLDGTDIQIPEKYREQAERFANALPK